MSELCHSGILPSVESPPISFGHCALDANGGALRRGGDCVNLASPRLVTTGGNFFPSETSENPRSALAFIDWFAFTVTPPDGCGLPWVFGLLVDLFHIPEMTSTGKGWFGYAHRLDLGGFGILAHGGEVSGEAITLR